MHDDVRLVTVYTQPNCLPCKRVIAKLRNAHIEVDVVDVSKDESARRYLTDVLNVSSTPVVETFGYETIVGYEPSKLRELIENLVIERSVDDIHDYVTEEEDL